jgi:hypothetical protein
LGIACRFGLGDVAERFVHFTRGVGFAVIATAPSRRIGQEMNVSFSPMTGQRFSSAVVEFLFWSDLIFLVLGLFVNLPHDRGLILIQKCREV